MWTWTIVDTVSGNRLQDVIPVSNGWARVMNGIGSGSHAFVASAIGDNPNASGNSARRTLTAPWARTLVVSWDGISRYAGIILKRTYNPDTNRITIEHSELREIFKRRFTFGTNGYQGEGGGKLIIEKNTIASLVGWLIYQALQGTASNWSLPVILPPRNIAGPHTRTWHDYNFPVIESELTELQNAFGGPDIDFTPEWTEDRRLVWRSRVGALTGRRLEANLSAIERPKATKVVVTEDGAKSGNMLYALGDGQERDMLVRKARANTDQPALERIENYAQLKDLGWLQNHADADLATFRNPTEQVSFVIRAGDKPGVNDLVLGQPWGLYTKNSGWFDDGWHDYRLISYASADLGENITLQMQPVTGG